MSLEKTISKYNASLIWLLGTLEKKNRYDADISRLKSRVRNAKGIDPESLIKYSWEYLINYSDDIVNRNTNQLLYGEIKELEHVPAEEMQFVMSIIKKIRSQYPKLTKTEQDQIYEKVIEMLKCAIEYAEEMNLVD